MPSFLQRLASVFNPAKDKSLTVTGQVIKSTPIPENPYPKAGNRYQPIGGLKNYRDLPVYTWTEWESVPKVKAALAALEGGQFQLAAQLVDAMGRDDRIAGVLNTRINGLLGLPIDIDLDEGGTEQVGEALKKNFRKMFPKPQARRLLRYGIMLGASLAENDWEKTETEWTPKLRVWHPQFLSWRWDTRSFWVSADGGQIEITPGDGQWVVYAPYGEQLGWLEGMVRALAIPWLIRQWARRDWARYSEVHGLPIRLGKVPSKAEEIDKERFIDELAQLATESVIRLPQGTEEGTSFGVELLEASSQSWQGFKECIQQTDTAIAVTLLGQNLTTEAGTGTKGALATARVHEVVRQDVIESDASTLTDCFHEQTVRPWATYNFGDPESAPQALYHTDPPPDMSVKATTLKTVGDALNSLKMVRAPVDVEQVMTDFGIPFEEGDEFPDFTEEPVPVPGQVLPGQPGAPAPGQQAAPAPVKPTTPKD